MEAIRLFKILNRDQRNTFLACFLGWSLTAFSPNYTTLLIFRALYGIGMGGEWGLGASLAMESLPTETRGLFSGILQQGYMFGYLLAAVVYWLVFPFFGWRGLFIAGALPAFLVLYIRTRVPES